MRSLVHLQSLDSEIYSKFNLTYGNRISNISTVIENNRAAQNLTISDPPRFTPRSKHIAIQYHRFRSHLGIKDGNGIVIKEVELALNKTDFLTKALAQECF